MNLTKPAPSALHALSEMGPATCAQLSTALNSTVRWATLALIELVESGLATEAFLLDPETCERVLIPGKWEITPAGRDVMESAT